LKLRKGTRNAPLFLDLDSCQLWFFFWLAEFLHGLAYLRRCSFEEKPRGKEVEMAGGEINLTPLQAANIAVLVKARMHELQDLIDEYGERFGDSGYLLGNYGDALNKVNSILPEDMQQIWIRETEDRHNKCQKLGVCFCPSKV
jgi:hypothetical protein